MTIGPYRHSRASGNPEKVRCMPAFAGMTKELAYKSRCLGVIPGRHWIPAFAGMTILDVRELLLRYL
jgi:hypothetical protein